MGLEAQHFQEVISAAREGSEWALACLYREIQPPLLGYLRTRDSGEAEDLASETWIAVARGLSRFRGDEAGFRGWVFTIARRRVIDLRRSQARRPITTPMDSGELPHAFIAADGVEGEVIRSAGTSEALAWIATLPPVQAEVVRLRVVAGLSADQVGQVIGKRPGAVRVLQHRALQRLAAQLTGEDGRGEDGRIEVDRGAVEEDDASLEADSA